MPAVVPPCPAPEAAHEEKGGVLCAITGGVPANNGISMVSCLQQRGDARGPDDFGAAAPYQALSVAGTNGVFLEVRPSEHAVA